MADLRQAIPAEEEEADEGRLEEEGHQPFDRQRGAEDVADIVRVIGPVHAELELHGDAGRDPHGEIDRSEEHTSELQSLRHLVCRLLLEKKNNTNKTYI